MTGLLLSIVVTLGLNNSTKVSVVVPVTLKCEHLVDPLGIDVCHPRLSWKIQCDARDEKQRAYALTVSADSAGRYIRWKDSVNSPAQLVIYNGPILQSFTRYYWKVSIKNMKGQTATSRTATFETGPMHMDDWQGDWITDKKDINIKTAPYFRKSFSVQKTIVSARAYIVAAGLYQLYINGQRVGDHILDPAFTRFDRRSLYVTYDVTKQLQRGPNVIGVLLGNGWYNMQSSAVWFFDKAPWRGRPCYCMDLYITYSDGSTEIISTDKSWKSSLSPVIFNSIYTGEHRDADKAILGWNVAEFDDSKWAGVTVTHAPSEHIVAQEMYPIHDCEKLQAISVLKFNDTDYLFNIGRNIAGVSEITVKGIQGTIIKLKHAERLDSTGHADQSNINYHYRPVGDGDPFQTDVYMLDGKIDTFRPYFNYKGFQYVEVTSNAPIALNQSSLMAYFEHSDVPKVGTIHSSNELINQIWQSTTNSYLSNLFGYPTDCPQREKNGWTGDAHTAVETGLYNFDGITIYEKWLADIRDAQQSNGTIPAIVPTSDWGYDHHNGPDWVSAIAIIPWELYVFYGDSKALFDNYQAIKSYVDLLSRRYPNYLCNWGLGDWIPIHSRAPVEFTSTVFYYQDALILAKAAKLLEKQEDAAFYGVLTEKIKAAFNQKYLDKTTGNYDQGFQTELSFALFYRLVPETLKAKTAALLAKAVETGGIHLDIGLLGSKTILNALSENRYADLAYKLATLTTYPSWGYWMKQDMTTLPEEWEINQKSDGSLNHIMFGEISAWFYKGLGGIIPDEQQPGFYHILLHPHIPGGLYRFSAEHESPYGQIVSGWSTKNSITTYTAVVPPNSSADLELNFKDKIIKRAHLGSGTYNFTIKQ